MTQRQIGGRPCSAILDSAVRHKGRVTGNDSSSVWDCMSWGYEGNLRNLECGHHQVGRNQFSQSVQLGNGGSFRGKCGCCEDGEIIDVQSREYYGSNERNQVQGNAGLHGQDQRSDGKKVTGRGYGDKQKQTRGTVGTSNQQNAISSNRNNSNQVKQGSNARSPRYQAPSPVYDRMEVEEIKKRRLDELMKSKQKSLERVKVQAYVESQKPFSRGMSNTQFRTFYGKQCMESYGRNNTNEPIGGIIYGNHLKTFNINPHASSNDPKHYQTHTTALNFAKRSKLDEQKNWNLLEKQLGKQLNLKAVNETLVPGKDVVYQDVTSENMYAAMKVNHEFAKHNREEIRNQEREYKRNEVLKQWAVQDEYKAQRQQDKEILKNAPLGSTMAASQAEEEFRRAAGSSQDRMNRQVIYKMVDSDGNVRYGADRHSLTCFVDMNFPENEGAYRAELMKRNQIFPIRVREEDRHLDEIRKENFVESVVNNYPDHYLIPNVDYSKVVLRPGADKRRNQSREVSKQKRPQSSHVGTRGQAGSPPPVFQNTKVGTNLNIVGSPKSQARNKVQFQGNNSPQDKTNYFNQSTKMSLGNTHGNHLHQTQHQGKGPAPIDNLSYTNTLKNALLDQSSKNPHFATELLLRASDNPHTIPSKNQRLVNQQYDSHNYYPHANHELKPHHHSHIKATKIPYAGVESNILDAIH